MTRQEVIKELEAYRNLDTDIISSEAIEVCLKSLKDKKARYWKRRWLKMRDNTYKVIEMFEQNNKPASAAVVRIVCLGGNNGVDTDNETKQET